MRRAFPRAEIKGDMIRIGIWHMQLIDGRLTLPSARPAPLLSFSRDVHISPALRRRLAD